MVSVVNFSFHFLFCLFVFYLLYLIFLLNLTRVFCFVFFPVSVSSVQSLSHVQLCYRMNFSMPGFHVHHQIPELAHTHCPSGWWCHPTISSSVARFPSCLQSFPVSGSFPRSQFFPLGAQRIGASDSASVLPMNIQDWFPLELTGWISLQSKELSESSLTPQFKGIYCSAFFMVQLSTSIHDYWKNHSFD